MEKLYVDDAFHIHTYRCGHAGTERETEYVKKAIALGVKRIFFCDHGPFKGNPFGNRMQYEELEDYVTTLQLLRERYQEQIDIKISLEMEYVPAYKSWYEQLLGAGNLDMLLLGQHFSWIPEEKIYTFQSKEKMLEAGYLAEGMMQGMESGFFKAVAHPCQIFRRIDSWTEKEDVLSKEIKECAAYTGVALEKNISNMLAKRKKRVYWQEFWKDVPREVKIIYGLDAHSVNELEENYRKQVKLFANEGKLNED